jgi:hypothetical protein
MAVLAFSDTRSKKGPIQGSREGRIPRQYFLVVRYCILDKESSMYQRTVVVNQRVLVPPSLKVFLAESPPVRHCKTFK